MKTRKLIGLGVLLAMVAGPAAAHEGHTTWGNWDFDWEVKDGAGIALRHVVFKGTSFLFKASMPVIRVHYLANLCGPYADRIDWSDLVFNENCGFQKVCQREFTQNGHTWLEVGVYARIAAYHLYQAWYLSDNGWLQARLSSKGLECPFDHEHHPYWRFDFDIAGFDGDQIFDFNNDQPNVGWGNGWKQENHEFNQTKNPLTDRDWFVRDAASGKGAKALPGDHDGGADPFSSLDVAGRLYHAAEDQSWQVQPNQELGFNEGEDIKEKDVVYWYVCHMHHGVLDPSDQWHTCGPSIFLGF